MPLIVKHLFDSQVQTAISRHYGVGIDEPRIPPVKAPTDETGTDEATRITIALFLPALESARPEVSEAQKGKRFPPGANLFAK